MSSIYKDRALQNYWKSSLRRSFCFRKSLL